jgi:hypothetical protein
MLFACFNVQSQKLREEIRGTQESSWHINMQTVILT